MFIGVRGKGIISFGSGQPDLPPPKEVFSCKIEKDDFKYGLIAGQEYLREALTEEYKDSTKDDFVVTNGASEALDLVFRAIAKPKDKILLHTPYYYSYRPLVEMNNFVPSYVKTNKGKIDIDYHIMDLDPEILNWAKENRAKEGFKITTHTSGNTHLNTTKNN